MLMQVKPENRRTFGLNAKKAWYTGPCLNHYRAFKGVLPSTGGERISDTVKFQHHAIDIPTLTPADRILEATRQLQDAIRQQPKRAPMDELRAIELLREVMLGEKRTSLPKNSVQIQRQRQRKAPPEERAPKLATPLVPVSTASPTPATTRVPKDVDEPLPELDANYVSDDVDDDFADTMPGLLRRGGFR